MKQVMKTKQRLMMAALTLCVLAALHTNAQADPVSFTINPTTQSGAAGSVLMFSGTFANLGAPSVTITNGSVNFSNPGVVGLTLNDDGFLNNFLGMTVAPMNQISAPLFTVTIGANAVPGTYAGVFSITYDGATLGQDTFQTFSVTVQPTGAPVPEPTTMLLLGSGLAGVAVKVRKRRSGNNAAA